MIMPPLQETVLFNRLTDLRRTNSNAQILAGKLLELDTVATNVLALNPSYLLALHRAWKAALLDSDPSNGPILAGGFAHEASPFGHRQGIVAIGYALAASSCERARAWMHAPPQHSAQLPLSQYQTPTPSREGVGFFRSGGATGSPRYTDHPAYFGLTSTISPFYHRLAPDYTPVSANVNIPHAGVVVQFEIHRAMNPVWPVGNSIHAIP